MSKPWTNRTAAVEIIRRCRAAGHEALLAGGCVRDMLMSRRPKDYDVATDATPQQVMRLFRRTRKVGMQFGVVLVGLGGQWIEVATFRSDLDYADGRHPERVIFSSPQEDAQRRDFTVNGMFYDPLSKRVIDYVGGQADLQKRVIRAIGEPARRFAEDHLRMVRAVRFAVQLQFRIEPQTLRAIKEHAESIRRVSAERIREELELILAEPRRAAGLDLVAQTGLLEHLWPGDDWPAARVRLVHAALAKLPRRCSLELALAAMLSGLAPKRADRICRDLACSNQVRNAVVWLLQQQAPLDEPKNVSLADLKFLMQNDHFGDLLALLRATLGAENRSQGPYRQIRRRAAAVPPESIRPEPLLNGHDLMAMGLEPGPLFKKLLDAVYRAQLDEEVATKDDALRMVRQMANPR